LDAVSLERRLLVMAPLLSALAARGASPIDQRETLVLLPDRIRFQAWGHLPPGSGEMAKLYGDFDKPGPYLVLMKWNPGWFSRPTATEPTASRSWFRKRGGSTVARISPPSRPYRFRQAGLFCATPEPGTTTACLRMDMSRLSSRSSGLGRSISGWPIPQNRPGGTFKRGPGIAPTPYGFPHGNPRREVPETRPIETEEEPHGPDHREAF
jgi:hypothetical protein